LSISSNSRYPAHHLGTAAIWQPLAIWQLRRFGDLGDLLKRFSIGDLGTPAIWRFGSLGEFQVGGCSDMAASAK